MAKSGRKSDRQEIANNANPLRSMTHDQIAERAYALYLLHAEDGHDVEDWLQAEQELREAQQSAKAA